MPFPYLVDDVLDIIFDSVHDNNLDPTSESQMVYSSLALVSKRFLPFARSRLYLRPLNPRHHVPQLINVASKLVSSLLSKNGYLGRLVQSLFGLDAWTMQIPRDQPAFHLQLLEACPNIRSLALLLSNRSDFDAAVTALSSTPRIERLALTVANTEITHAELGRGPSAVSSSEPWNDSVIHDALNRSPFANVSDLELDLRYHLSTSVLDCSTSLPLSKFCLDAGNVRLNKVLQFFPADMSTITDCTVCLPNIFTLEIAYILELLSDKTRYLSLENASNDMFGPSLENYRSDQADQLTLPRVAIFQMQHFPLLTRLSLLSFRGPSITLLETLAESSPLLANLSFEKSFWITEKKIPVGTRRQQYLDLVFEEEEVVQALEKFRRLDIVDLGFLPFVADSPKNDMALMKRFAKERGVIIRWETVTKIPTMNIWL